MFPNSSRTGADIVDAWNYDRVEWKSNYTKTITVMRVSISNWMNMGAENKQEHADFIPGLCCTNHK